MRTVSSTVLLWSSDHHVHFHSLSGGYTCVTSQYNETPQITITQNGVYKLLHGLKQHKATGPDEISTKFLKEMVAPVTPALTFIFQASLNQGQTPEDWKCISYL
jgi:hypothetical protein